jgi:hypothetical protein
VPIPANSSVVPWAIGLTAATLGNSASADVDRARALRFLVHFAGDVHQPLHAAEMYSADFPEGDLGGNYFKVSVPGYPSIDNLHYYWDAGATQVRVCSGRGCVLALRLVAVLRSAGGTHRARLTAHTRLPLTPPIRPLHVVRAVAVQPVAPAELQRRGRRAGLGQVHHGGVPAVVVLRRAQGHGPVRVR